MSVDQTLDYLSEPKTDNSFSQAVLKECSLNEAKKQIGWCCATLCDKQVVEKALPKISYEEAVAYLHDNLADWKDGQFVYTETAVRDLINKIYGK